MRDPEWVRERCRAAMAQGICYGIVITMMVTWLLFQIQRGGGQ